MRRPWDENSGERARRRRRSDRSGLSGPPYDFAGEDEQQDDPVDLLAIHADDELLDALASGRHAGPAFTHGFDPRWDPGYADDQQVLAILADWRDDVSDEPIPELVSPDEAVAAILAGQRASTRPRRRLVPVAAAAAVFAIALGGVAVAAGNAQPGDPLWGVSKVMDGNRAKSVEAAYHVDTVLASAQQALAQGRVADAQAALASVAPELNQVQDQQRKEELAQKTDNLREVVSTTPEGKEVDTDERGRPRPDNGAGNGGPNQGAGPSGPSGQNPPASTDQHKPGQNPDQRGNQGPDQRGNQNPGQQHPGQDPRSGENQNQSPDQRQHHDPSQNQNPDPRRSQNPDQKSDNPGAGQDPRSAQRPHPAPGNGQTGQDNKPKPAPDGRGSTRKPSGGNNGGGSNGAGNNGSGSNGGGSGANPGPGKQPAPNANGNGGRGGSGNGTPGAGDKKPSGGADQKPSGDNHKNPGAGRGEGEPQSDDSSGATDKPAPNVKTPDTNPVPSRPPFPPS